MDAPSVVMVNTLQQLVLQRSQLASRVPVAIVPPQQVELVKCTASLASQEDKATVVAAASTVTPERTTQLELALHAKNARLDNIKQRTAERRASAVHKVNIKIKTAVLHAQNVRKESTRARWGNLSAEPWEPTSTQITSALPSLQRLLPDSKSRKVVKILNNVRQEQEKIITPALHALPDNTVLQLR